MSTRAAVLALLLAGCGTATGGEGKIESAAEVPSEKPRAPHKRQEVPMLEADVGSLDEAGVKAAFADAKSDVTDCLLGGSKRLGYLAGAIEAGVRIAKDGTVKYALVFESTLGDRATEQCILDALKKRSWPAPKGGREGEARQHLDYIGRGRPAVVLTPEQLGGAFARARAELKRCRKEGGVTVTVHFDPSGKPLTAGAAADGPEAAGAIDCSIAAMMKLRFPSPGSWTGKATIAP